MAIEQPTGSLLALAAIIGLAALIATIAKRMHVIHRSRSALAEANRTLTRARDLAAETSLRLDMMLAGMSDGIVMVTADLRLVQWNEQFVQLLSLDRDALYRGQMLEKILRIQARAREPDPERVEAAVARELAMARTAEWPSVAIERMPNGTVLELRRSRLPDGGWVTLYSDITARKLNEDAERLAREQTESAMRENTRFVAIVSHEIRTPLNVALNSLGLLEGADLTPAQRQWVETGLLAAESLMGLLNDVLDLSRMQAGRLQLRPAPFALVPLLEGVVDMFRAQALERGVELSVEVASGIPERLMTDAGRLRQVLMNLVSNTAKFAEPGAASIRVGFATMAGVRVLRFAVRDCGPGISDLDRARLFRPFSQLEQPGSTGIGLGLAICQLLADLLGGQIGYDPLDRGGKEFWLTLPADMMDVPVEVASLPASSPLPSWLPRTRVLLVDDVVANQSVVATVLRREGHMVDVASSGLEALEKVATGAYDLVFLDILMPGIDGLETARRIRAMTGHAQAMPLVALTAYVSAADRSAFIAAGLDDLVPKPVQRSALLAAMARHVWAGRRRQSGEMPMFDPNQVASWRQGLRTSVSDALFAACLDQLRHMLPALRAALTEHDRAGVEQVVHGVIGVAATYGLAGLEAIARSLHGTALDGIDIAGILARFDGEIDRAELEFRRLLPSEAA